MTDAVKQLTPRALADWLADTARAKPLLLDVREPGEFQLCHLPDSVHVPMSSLPARMNELDPDAEMVVICHHGVRSFQVAHFLRQQGFRQLYNLHGGVDAWARTINPDMPVY